MNVRGVEDEVAAGDKIEGAFVVERGGTAIFLTILKAWRVDERKRAKVKRSSILENSLRCTSRIVGVK